MVFDNFYADMGEPPPGLTLDRRDNDGHYEPENCYWATLSEQRKNQRPRSMVAARRITAPAEPEHDDRRKRADQCPEQQL
jgi:hypothetical protein